MASGLTSAGLEFLQFLFILASDMTALVPHDSNIYPKSHANFA